MYLLLVHFEVLSVMAHISDAFTCLSKHFGKSVFLLSYEELDEKISITLICLCSVQIQ